MKRTTKVKDIKVNNIISGSVFQVGDVHGIDTKSRAIALHRQFPTFNTNEAVIDDYPIFSYKQSPFVLSHPVRVRTENMLPYINVNHIYITSAAAASVVQLGNSECVYSNSAVRHIRHIIDGYASLNNEGR